MSVKYILNIPSTHVLRISQRASVNTFSYKEDPDWRSLIYGIFSSNLKSNYEFSFENEFCYSYDDEKGGKYCFFFSSSLSLSFAFLVASNVTKYLLWCTGLLSDEKMCSLVSHYHFSWVWCQLTLIFALIFPSIFQGNKAKIQDLLLCFSLLECMFPSWTAVKGSRVLHSYTNVHGKGRWLKYVLRALQWFRSLFHLT